MNIGVEREKGVMDDARILPPAVGYMVMPLTNIKKRRKTQRESGGLHFLLAESEVPQWHPRKGQITCDQLD